MQNHQSGQNKLTFPNGVDGLKTLNIEEHADSRDKRHRRKEQPFLNLFCKKTYRSGRLIALLSPSIPSSLLFLPKSLCQLGFLISFISLTPHWRSERLHFVILFSPQISDCLPFGILASVARVAGAHMHEPKLNLPNALCWPLLLLRKIGNASGNPRAAIQRQRPVPNTLLKVLTPGRNSKTTLTPRTQLHLSFPLASEAQHVPKRRRFARIGQKPESNPPRFFFLFTCLLAFIGTRFAYTREREREPLRVACFFLPLSVYRRLLLRLFQRKIQCRKQKTSCRSYHDFARGKRGCYSETPLHTQSGMHARVWAATL